MTAITNSKWTASQNYRFVELYVQHPCLFNAKSNLYKNKRAREAALTEISKCMNLSGTQEAYRKSRIIRSTYFQELRKIKDSLQSGANGYNVYVPNIKWFKMFDDALKSSRSHSQYEDTQSNMVSTVSIITK